MENPCENKLMAQERRRKGEKLFFFSSLLPCLVKFTLLPSWFRTNRLWGRGSQLFSVDAPLAPVFVPTVCVNKMPQEGNMPECSEVLLRRVRVLSRVPVPRKIGWESLPSPPPVAAPRESCQICRPPGCCWDFWECNLRAVREFIVFSFISDA